MAKKRKPKPKPRKVQSVKLQPNLVEELKQHQENSLAIDRIETQEVQRMVDNKYEYYIPTGKTSQFLEKFGSTDYFVTYYAGANGVGKTALLANIVANICWGSSNEWFTQKLFTDYPYDVKVIRIVSDANTLKETLIPTLKEWFPKGRFTTHKGGKQYEYHWVTDTGWEIFILTYDQPLSTHESANVSMVLFDEPPPRAIYIANVSRLRRGGQIGIVATPLEGSEWMYDAIITSTDDNTAYVEAEVEDACIDCGERGFLEHDAIQKMIANYSEEDKQARVYGKFQHLTGLVFKEWDREVHVIEPFPIERKKFVTWHSLDPHPRTADAAAWVAVDELGDLYVIDEVFENFDTGGLARRLRDRDMEYEVEDRLIDPWALDEDQHTQKSLASRLSEHGVTGYRPGSKKRSQAVSIFHDYLSHIKKGEKLIRPPRLYVFSTCKRMIWEMEHWKYLEYSPKTAQKRGASNKPQDKDDHMIEAVGRILLANPSFYTPEKKERVRSIDYGTVGDPY